MMRKIYLTIVTLLIVSIVNSQTPGKTFPESVKKLQNPTKCDSKNIANGVKIYKKVCWTCHGDNGIGNGPGAKEIKTKVADFNDPVVKGRTDGELFWWITSGGNDMQPFKDVLSREEIWQTVCYIRKIQTQ